MIDSISAYPSPGKRRDAMRDCELKIPDTGRHNGDKVQAAEVEGIEILASFVPGSPLHEVIQNPIDSGIDEA